MTMCHMKYPFLTHGRHAHAMNQANREMERIKDLAATYEQSIANKDQVIANLTGALQRQVGLLVAPALHARRYAVCTVCSVY